MSKKKNKSVSVSLEPDIEWLRKQYLSLEQSQRDARRQALLYGKGKIKNNFLGNVSGFTPYTCSSPYYSFGEPVREPIPYSSSWNPWELDEKSNPTKPAKPEPPPLPPTPAEQRLAKLKGVLEKVRALEI